LTIIALTNSDLHKICDAPTVYCKPTQQMIKSEFHFFGVRWGDFWLSNRDACFTIQPSELMDPEFNSNFGSGYESDLKTFGTLTPASDTVQGDRMPIKFHEFSGYKSLQVYNNGDIDGKINENFNYDAQGEIGLLDRSMTSSESDFPDL
jgi:hypothetical protein